jgi:hypothetical protein
MGTTSPNIVIIPDHTVTSEETVTTIFSRTTTASEIPTTITSSIVTTTIVTATSVPTDGIFINTTVEIIVFITVIVLVITNVGTALQFKRIRGQQDNEKNIRQLVGTIIEGNGD